MNVRLRPVRWSPLVFALTLSQCVMEPPGPPPGYYSGYSLDSGPNLRRNRQETRYLENTQPPPLPDPGNAGVIASAPPPSYETPAIYDSAGQPTTNPPTAPENSAPIPPTSDSPPATSIPPEPATPPAPAVKPSTPEQMPFGLPVPSKKGFVYSPFDKSQMVDVRGIPPGKKVRCPYTSKIFLVP
jgi:hypothetical protein